MIAPANSPPIIKASVLDFINSTIPDNPDKKERININTITAIKGIKDHNFALCNPS